MSEVKTTITLKRPEAESETMIEVEAEKIYLCLLRREPVDMKVARANLMTLFSNTTQSSRTMYFLRQISEITRDLEVRALHLLCVGKTREVMSDYESASILYKEALNLVPGRNRIWYYINSNFAFCLNAKGEYVEAERHARKAIEIDAAAPDAFQNLGISLAGQGKLADASRYLNKAIPLGASQSLSEESLGTLLSEFAKTSTTINEIFKKVREAAAGEKAGKEKKGSVAAA